MGFSVGCPAKKVAGFVVFATAQMTAPSSIDVEEAGHC
jgi:hypothetical protein